jgi:hypothetical protein
MCGVNIFVAKNFAHAKCPELMSGLKSRSGSFGNGLDPEAVPDMTLILYTGKRQESSWPLKDLIGAPQ